MSSKLRLKSENGGSVTLTVDPEITEDEEYQVENLVTTNLNKEPGAQRIGDMVIISATDYLALTPIDDTIYFVVG